jgi:hypothetical protein
MNEEQQLKLISFLYKYFSNITPKAPRNKKVDLPGGTSFKRIVEIDYSGKSEHVKTLSITHMGRTFILKDYMTSNRFTVTMAGEGLIDYEYVGNLFTGNRPYFNTKRIKQIRILEDSIPKIYSSFD